MKIIKPNYRWNGYPVKRNGPPKGIVYHHQDANDGVPNDGLADVMGIHAYHRDTNGWRGIGYHFYVALNGDAYQGRPIDTIGGHAMNAGDWIGICAEGDYDKSGAKMPAAQLKTIRELTAYIESKYGKLPKRRHSEMPGNLTACPGRSYPFAEVIKAPVKKPAKTALTDKNISVPRQKKPNRAGWWNLGLVPFIAKLRAQGQGKRVKTEGKESVVIPVPKTRPKWWRKMWAWKKGKR